MEPKAIRYISDGLAVNLNFGFIPEYCLAIHDIDATSPDKYEWFKAMEDESTAQYGILTTGTTGVITELTTAATGAVKYNPGQVLGVLVPSPVAGAVDVFATIADYATGTTYTARSATAVGSIVRPVTASYRNTGLVFECTTASGGAG